MSSSRNVKKKKKNVQRKFVQSFAIRYLNVSPSAAYQYSLFDD